MQLYYCSLILLQLHQPCYGGFKEYLERQKTLKRWARMVCGIAMTCTDHAASVMPSQCVFIGNIWIWPRSQLSMTDEPV